MDKIRRLKDTLLQWNSVFCKGMTCKTNLKRDAIIISVAIFLSAFAIGTDRYLQSKKTHLTQVAGAEEIIMPIKKAPVEETSPTKEEFEFKPVMLAAPIITEPKETLKPKPAPAKKIVHEAKSTGASCIKIPDHILVKLKNPPVPPDGKVKNGKLICHVLAEGKKDNPHSSSKNPKGKWGGCCYDPDEVPNPRCCYPVGSVYEKHLQKYFADPFPLRKKR